MEDEELQIQVGLLATRTGVELRTINAIIVGLRESTGLTGALGVPGEETFVDAIARLDGLISASTDIDDAVTSSQTAWSSYKTDLEIATAIADLVGTVPDLLNTLEEIVTLVTNETGVLDAVEALVATNATAIADETAARIAAISDEQTARSAEIAVEASDRQAADASIQSSVDAISASLTADDAAYDTAQERIDRIKSLAASISGLGIGDVSGLQGVIDNLATTQEVDDSITASVTHATGTISGLDTIPASIVTYQVTSGADSGLYQKIDNNWHLINGQARVDKTFIKFINEEASRGTLSSDEVNLTTMHEPAQSLIPAGLSVGDYYEFGKNTYRVVRVLPGGNYAGCQEFARAAYSAPLSISNTEWLDVKVRTTNSASFTLTKPDATVQTITSNVTTRVTFPASTTGEINFSFKTGSQPNEFFCIDQLGDGFSFTNSQWLSFDRYRELFRIQLEKPNTATVHLDNFRRYTSQLTLRYGLSYGTPSYLKAEYISIRNSTGHLNIEDTAVGNVALFVRFDAGSIEGDLSSLVNPPVSIYFNAPESKPGDVYCTNWTLPSTMKSITILAGLDTDAIDGILKACAEVTTWQAITPNVNLIGGNNGSASSSFYRDQIIANGGTVSVSL